MPDPLALPDTLTTLLDAYTRAVIAHEWATKDERRAIYKAKRDESRAALVEYVAPLIEARRRLDTLARFLDKNGGARFSVWANEMVELEGVADPDEYEPFMFDTLDFLLDALARSTPEAP